MTDDDNDLLEKAAPRRFQLDRSRDRTGISGKGIVAEGIEHRDGSVQYHWLSSPSTWQMAQSIHDVQHLHGHAGKTQVRWLDDPGPRSKEQDMADLYAERNRLALTVAALADRLDDEEYAGGWHPEQDTVGEDLNRAITWAKLPTGYVQVRIPDRLTRILDDDMRGAAPAPVPTTEENSARLVQYLTENW